MPKHHTVITGTGRAGTTFLVQLLTALKLDTGFDSPTSNVFANCNAGMELDILDPNAPYYVKAPILCDRLDELVGSGHVVVDHAIVPMRDLFSAAESRREVSRSFGPTDRDPNQIPGGLWNTNKAEAQESVLLEQIYQLMYAITKHEIPLTLLHFPRIVKDPEYLYDKLRFTLGEMSYATFLQGFQLVSRPELVHDFTQVTPPLNG